jgi:hypothetical protein
MKKLKYFSYYVQWGTYDKHVLHIAATSQKQVIELLGKLHITVSATYIRDYFYKAWGNDMEGIEATEPCVYATKGDRFSANKNKPIKLI